MMLQTGRTGYTILTSYIKSLSCYAEDFVMRVITLSLSKL